MLKYINAMTYYSNIVCVLMFCGTLVTAFPTGDYDEVVPCLIEVPVEGVAEFNGAAPASGSVTILGHSACPPILLSNPVTPTDSKNSNTIVTIKDQNTYSSIHTENNEDDKDDRIPKEVILGAILADAIMTQKGEEIDAKLAEVDAFVETEMGKLGPLLQTALVNTDTSEVDQCVESTLLEIESQIESELAMIDDFIESELEITERLVESVIENVDLIPHLETTEYSAEEKLTHKETLIEMELAMLESFVESELANTESFIESELEKVNTLVESELAKVDTIVDSELAKVDLFVETELAKTDALVKSELTKMESFIETELANVELPVEGVVEFGGVVSATGSTTIIGSCGCDDLIFTNQDERVDDIPQPAELPITAVEVRGTFPVSGRTLIIGSTGCPPIFPTAEPLPIYVESFPVIESMDYSETYEPESVAEQSYDDTIDTVTEIPVAGDVVFSGVAHAVGSCHIEAACPCDPLLPLLNRDTGNPPTVGLANPSIATTPVPSNNGYHHLSSNNMQNAHPDSALPHIKILPTVNILRNRMTENQSPSEVAILNGQVEFSGTAKATGSTSLFVEFPCPPLKATEVGPDGRKYIWIARRPSDNDADTPSTPSPIPDCPISTFPNDFLETDIIDADKNYEKLISEDLDVDFGIIGL